MLTFNVIATPYTQGQSATGMRTLLTITAMRHNGTISLDATGLVSVQTRAALIEKLKHAAAEAKANGQKGVRLDLRPSGGKPPRGWPAFEKLDAHILI
jgi:hypothetical protein